MGRCLYRPVEKMYGRADVGISPYKSIHVKFQKSTGEQCSPLAISRKRRPRSFGYKKTGLTTSPVLFYMKSFIIGATENIIGRNAVKIGKSDKVTNGQLAFACFIARILRLCSIEQLCNIALLEVFILAQVFKPL